MEGKENRSPASKQQRTDDIPSTQNVVGEKIAYLKSLWVRPRPAFSLDQLLPLS